MPFQSKRVPPEKLSDWMQTARLRYTFALDLDREDRELAEEDARFAAAIPIKGGGGGTTQWDVAAAQARINAKRPCLTENRLQTFTAQVVNDGRQSKPAIKITAMDNGTKETAEFIQGRIRQIEYDCDADVAYDTAREQQVTCGRAFIRVHWEYEPRSFKKRPVIKPIPNQFSVLYGPSAEYDCSDADYCFVVNPITKEEHARKYGPETTAARRGYNFDFGAELNPAPGWWGIGANGDMLLEAEYWCKEYRQRTLCLMSNGKVFWKDEIPQGLDAIGITIEDERPELDVTVVQYIIDGADILKETEFIGPYIGIVPLWGREQFVDGKPRRTSLIRYAKDPQRLLNLYVSNIAEQIAMMPKTPWLVPVGGIPTGSENDWRDVNVRPLAYLYYNVKDPENGDVLPPPTRQTFGAPIAELVAGYNQAVDAIKAAMGIYDASLGNRSNETSGIAIDKRQKEADNANFHFHDNEARSRKQIGRILLCMLKEIDKGKGTRPIRSEEGKTRIVPIGQRYRDEEFNKEVIHDLSQGDYGPAVQTGPSYNSRREEAFDAYYQIASKDPGFMGLAGDIIFRASDFPGSDKIAERYEKLLPPALQPQKGEQPQLPPEVVAKWQQLQQVAGEIIEKQTQRIRELESDEHAQRLQIESRERIAAMQEETKRVVKLAELEQTQGLTLLKHELESISKRLDFERYRADIQYQADQAERDRQHQTAQQERAQQAEQQAQAAAAAQEAQPEPAPTPAAAPTEPAAAAPEQAPPEEPVLIEE